MLSTNTAAAKASLFFKINAATSKNFRIIHAVGKNYGSRYATFDNIYYFYGAFWKLCTGIGGGRLRLTVSVTRTNKTIL
jgi:hypothetical protein